MNLKSIIISFFLFGMLYAASAQKPESYQSFNNKLALGWNTWNYESMLSYVLLPEGLALNVNFRPAMLGMPYDPNYHFNKITYSKNGLVRPQAHTFDGAYTDVIIDDWKGNKIQIQSASENGNLFVLITPLINSNIKYFIEIETGFLYNKPGTVARNNNGFTAKTESGSIEISATHKAVEIARPYTTAYQSFSSGSELGICTGKSKALEDIKQIIQQAKNNFDLEAEQQYGEMAEAYKAMQSVLGWNTLYDADEIKKRGKEITPKVQSLWSEERGIYLNKNLDNGEFSERLSPTLFYPMIAGIPTEKQAERMFKEHYFNPDEFYGDYIIPSCARNDKSYDNAYWRGAIWGPMNFLVYLGLKNYNGDAAQELAAKSYNLFVEPWNKYKYVYENTHSELGASNYESQVNRENMPDGRYFKGGSYFLYDNLFLLDAYLHGIDGVEEMLKWRIGLDFKIGATSYECLNTITGEPWKPNMGWNVAIYAFWQKLMEEGKANAALLGHIDKIVN